MLTKRPTPLAEILRAPIGAEILGDGGHMRLVLTMREWRSGMSAEGPAYLAAATQDGRRVYYGEWHREEIDGPYDAREAVYAEVYAEIGRVFHGWIDARTRKVVQSG